MSGGPVETIKENVSDIATISTFEKKSGKKTITHPLPLNHERKTTTVCRTDDKECEQAQTESAGSGKIYETTKTKARNPILVMMLIMKIVTDTLKDSSDKTKETANLKRQLWKHYSNAQSSNYQEGESCQKHAMGGKSAKMLADLIASTIDERQLTIPYVGCLLPAKTVLNGVGMMSGAYSDTVFPQEQQRIQIKDAKFQHHIGHTSTDYQNQSQQASSDSQMLDGAREKSIQLGRIAAQMATAQPA